MEWIVVYSRKAAKLREKLPERVKAVLNALILDISATGPVRGDWPNYSKLSDGLHHCHLKKGQPTYVAVWRVQDN
jgi:hypothetical protein